LLYEQVWLAPHPAAVLIVVHGFGEHSSRYAVIAQQFATQGVTVYAFDLPGHGRSPGARGQVCSIDQLAWDVICFGQQVAAREPDQPLFLLGHSLGGAITTRTVMLLHDCQLPATAQLRHSLKGLILSAALLGLRAESPFTHWLVPLLGRYSPNLPLVRLNSRWISRDPAVVRAYESDPLVYHSKMTAKTIAAIFTAISAIHTHWHLIQVPLLILHGTADRLVPPDGSQWLYEQAGSANKQIQLYEGLYHELLNEPEKEAIEQRILAWMWARL
jgi:alpha-beta hydrolase superfamily lysophospholipase